MCECWRGGNFFNPPKYFSASEHLQPPFPLLCVRREREIGLCKTRHTQVASRSRATPLTQTSGSTNGSTRLSTVLNGGSANESTRDAPPTPQTRVTTLHTGSNQTIQSTEPSGATSSPSAQGGTRRILEDARRLLLLLYFCHRGSGQVVFKNTCESLLFAMRAVSRRASASLRIPNWLRSGTEAWFHVSALPLPMPGIRPILASYNHAIMQSCNQADLSLAAHRRGATKPIPHEAHTWR